MGRWASYAVLGVKVFGAVLAISASALLDIAGFVLGAVGLVLLFGWLFDVHWFPAIFVAIGVLASVAAVSWLVDQKLQERRDRKAFLGGKVRQHPH